MDILLAIFLSIRLHRLARDKGVEPTPWVLRFLGVWLVIYLAVVGVSMAWTDGHILEDPRSLFMTALVVVGCELMVFQYIRRLLERLPDPEPDEPEPEKDLSYFR